MKTLKEYTKNSLVIDAHVHAFDKDYSLCVCKNAIVFPDIHSDMNNEGAFYKAYSNYLPSCNNILACGHTDEQTLEIYKGYKDFMCGFGELLVNKIMEKGLDDVRRGWAYYTNTLEYADKNQLPILFHYDIDDVEDYVRIMGGILIRYPGVKFVHAHCGVTKPLLLKQDTRAIFDHERQLVENFDNYYLDLSWEVNKLFGVIAFISTLPETKWVIGSDTSAILYNTHYNKYQELKNDFDNLFIFHKQSTKNIKNIYK